jgi:6-phosphofructokinase 1
MRVGMLTGGGDCPGLNAVLRGAVRKGEHVYDDELVGFRDGWKGVVEGIVDDLSVERMRGTLPRGGTILGSSRTNPYKLEGGVERVKATLAEQRIDALIAIGGEDTLGVASKLSAEGVVGRPEVVVDRLRHADDLHALPVQPVGDAERVLAADRDQPVDAGLGQVGGQPLQPSLLLQRIGAR